MIYGVKAAYSILLEHEKSKKAGKFLRLFDNY